MAVLDSGYSGAHDSKITFSIRPLHIVTLLHLYTLKICLKIHVYLLKITWFSNANVYFDIFYHILLIHRKPVPSQVPLKTAYVSLESF